MESLLSSPEVLQLNAEMEEIMENWDSYTPAERVRQAFEYTEHHYRMTGEVARPNMLKQLSNFILADELTNSHPDKVARTEYPILTSKQVVRRQRKTVLTSDETVMDYLDQRYNSYKGGQSNQSNIQRRTTADKRS